MDITLIVPYHANADLLSLTLNSVLKQSASNWRVIVCDDSTNGSGKVVVDSFDNKQFQYLRNHSPAGMVANWNFGIAAAGTEWVSLLHADDELESNYIELMSSLISRYSHAGFIFCEANIIDLSGKLKFSFPDFIKRWFVPRSTGEIILEGEPGAVSLLRGNFIICPSICYKRDILLKHPFNSSYNMVQDLDYYLNLLLIGFKLIGSRSRAYRYRRHENATAILTRELTRFREEIQLFDRFQVKFKSQGWYEAAEVASAKRIIFLHLTYRLLCDIITLRFKAAARKIPIFRDLLLSGLLPKPSP